MIKQALEYLVGLGKTEIIEIENHKYHTNNLKRIEQPTANAIEVTTLTALVDYLKSGIDLKSPRMLIHVKSPREVVLYSDLKNDRRRELYIKCEALLPQIDLNRYMDVEKFNILLQSSFVRNNDCSILLKVVGNVKDEAVKTVGDNGISQAVTIKSGVAQVENVLVPNPVVLAPFRTFPEIEQVESKFIFRMRSGPESAIYEADGGAWRNEAMKRIKEYLQSELKETPEVEIIS